VPIYKKVHSMAYLQKPNTILFIILPTTGRDKNVKT